MSKVLVIPDIHFGSKDSHHPDVYKFLAAVKKKFSPDKVVCLGDLADWNSINMHDKSPEEQGPAQELATIRKMVKPLFKMFPKIMICTSNHDDLPFRRASKFGIPMELLLDHRGILEAPKTWVWADQWEIDGVIFEHGTGFSGKDGALKAAMANMQNTCIGHLHSHAGIQFYANAKTLLFGFNAGCLINKDSSVFSYAKHIKAKPIIGCGLIISGVPQFIPMPMDDKGRFTKL